MGNIESLAIDYDEMMGCDVGWAKGNFTRFKNWIEKRFIQGGPLNWEQIRDEYEQVATSECGGGGAAVYWYEIKYRGRPYYFGWANTMNHDDYYLVSVAEDNKRRVSVTNYRELPQDV
jgi:hypothetical protein